MLIGLPAVEARDAVRSGREHIGVRQTTKIGIGRDAHQPAESDRPYRVLADLPALRRDVRLTASPPGDKLVVVPVGEMCRADQDEADCNERGVASGFWHPIGIHLDAK